LTARDLFHTKRGKETQKHCNNDPSEFYGHSAIMFYYELDPDKYAHCHLEKTDFTSPKGFPKEMVTAILSGDMAEFGVNQDMVSGLLSDKGRSRYKKQCKAHAAREKAYAVRQKANAAWTKANAVCQKAHAAWQKADAAWTKANAVCQKAHAAWQKADAKVFWAIFANVKYRAKAWCV